VTHELRAGGRRRPPSGLNTGKEMQIVERKRKKKSFHFLLFPFPIRAFSMGYGGFKNKKNLFLSSLRRAQNRIQIQIILNSIKF
jgi:hypothetical protein